MNRKSDQIAELYFIHAMKHEEEVRDKPQPTETAAATLQLLKKVNIYDP